jgi:hypothetical protein
VYPLIVNSQRLSKHVTLAENTHSSRRIVGGVVFCAVRVTSDKSLQVCVSPIFAKQGLSKNALAATNNYWNWFSVRSVSHQSRVSRSDVCPVSLLSNALVSTFWRQGRIVGGVVFYAVHVVSDIIGVWVFPKLLDFN